MTVYKVSASDPAAIFTTIVEVNAHGNFSAGDQILFNKGETFAGTLDIKGSGAPGNPIVYGAYGAGNPPVLSGFQTVTGWFSEGGGIYSKILYPDAAPNVLLIDDVQRTLGRYPKTGWLAFNSFVTNQSITDDDLPDSPSWDGGEVVIFKNTYTIDRCRIDSQNNGTLAYTNLGTTRNVSTGTQYFIQNHINALTQYGDWCWKSSENKLCVYFGAVDPATKTVKVSLLNNVIADSTGEDYVTIDGILAEGSIGNAINFAYQNDHISLLNCTARFAGGKGIYISKDYATIQGNSVADCGGGIQVGGTNATINQNNTISRIGCLVGQNYQILTAIGIDVVGSNSVIHNNQLDRIGYMGIYAESTATISDIRYNKIDYPCQLVNDAGGIYMGHDHPGTVVDHNIVLYSGGNGIYLDEYCTGVTCTSNTIAHSAGNGIMLHKAHQNTVTDNNVFNNAVGIKFTNWDNVKNLYENILSRNTFVAKSGQIVANLTNRYTGDNEWGTGSGNYYCRPIDDGQSFDTNLPVVGGALKTFAQWKTIVNTDSTSAQSPAGITSDAQIQFEYNYSSADVLKAVPVASIDMAGIKYASSILLSAWSSAILIPDPSPAGGQNGSGLKKAFIASNGNYYLNPLTGKAYVH